MCIRRHEDLIINKYLIGAIATIMISLQTTINVDNPVHVIVTMKRPLNRGNRYSRNLLLLNLNLYDVNHWVTSAVVAGNVLLVDSINQEIIP